MLEEELSGFDKDKAKAYLGGNKAQIAAVNADEAMHGGFLTNIADGMADTMGVERDTMRAAVGGAVGGAVLGPFAPLAGPILGAAHGTDFGTDNKALYEALESCKDQKERDELIAAYKERTHGRDLLKDVDADLEGKEKDVAKYIMAGDKAGAEAAKMASAAEGLGTDKKAIYAALERPRARKSARRWSRSTTSSTARTVRTSTRCCRTSSAISTTRRPSSSRSRVGWRTASPSTTR
ncbi:MAG: hypothetical protein IPQ07_07095 [Myxococcales bacterium]|nr:hypothetical protein [Myxococcales bacterium]